MVEVLTIGPVHTLVQDRVYALPAKSVYINSDVDLQISGLIDDGFIDLSNKDAKVSALFIRSTSKDAVVRLTL